MASKPENDVDSMYQIILSETTKDLNDSVNLKSASITRASDDDRKVEGVNEYDAEYERLPS